MFNDTPVQTYHQLGVTRSILSFQVNIPQNSMFLNSEFSSYLKYHFHFESIHFALYFVSYFQNNEISILLHHIAELSNSDSYAKKQDNIIVIIIYRKAFSRLDFVCHLCYKTSVSLIQTEYHFMQLHDSMKH